MAVKYFAWDDANNAKLRADRGIGFEDIVFHIERGDLLDILEHSNPGRYSGQRIFFVRRDDYVYLVPFPPSPASSRGGLRRGLAVALRAEVDVEDEHTVFLKTIIGVGTDHRALSDRAPAFGVLKSENETERFLLLRPGDIVVSPDDGEQGGVAIGFTLPQRDVPRRRLESIRTDGDVDGGDPG